MEAYLIRIRDRQTFTAWEWIPAIGAKLVFSPPVCHTVLLIVRRAWLEGKDRSYSIWTWTQTGDISLVASKLERCVTLLRNRFLPRRGRQSCSCGCSFQSQGGFWSQQLEVPDNRFVIQSNANCLNSWYGNFSFSFCVFHSPHLTIRSAALWQRWWWQQCKLWMTDSILATQCAAVRMMP